MKIPPQSGIGFVSELNIIAQAFYYNIGPLVKQPPAFVTHDILIYIP